ncbi:hypothetical protein SH601_14890 [Gracilibacillus sp. S3-1-1]|uniref:Uncharacterized protein n=1 Tax=Gracilibacillus pellucidus TaxID=3095368 RepID=A0ACC6M8G1_9BACI|nr:hypothetical protein [Gracilibacillus sp. S3-1-1]MDX8047254.1 hypothetical protein [Gracilibacillus sp. S3-1-1]
MTDQWIEEFPFPEKTMEGSGRQPLNLDYIHEELAKPNVTLSLLHHEYEAECRSNQKSHIPIVVLHATTVSMQISIKLLCVSVENRVRSWKLTGVTAKLD